MNRMNDHSMRAVLIDVSRGSAWFPCTVFGVHVLASRGFDAYEQFPPLDVPMHVLGGVAIAYFLWGAVVAAERAKIIMPTDPLVRIVLVLALTTSATVFWEFAEWTTDHTIGTGAQKGLDDTLFDMLCGIVGGTMLALFRIKGAVSKTQD